MVPNKIEEENKKNKKSYMGTAVSRLHNKFHKILFYNKYSINDDLTMKWYSTIMFITSINYNFFLNSIVPISCVSSLNFTFYLISLAWLFRKN